MLSHNLSLQYKSWPIASARALTSSSNKDAAEFQVTALSAQVTEEEPGRLMRVSPLASKESGSDYDSGDEPLLWLSRTGTVSDDSRPSQGNRVRVKIKAGPAGVYSPRMPRMTSISNQGQSDRSNEGHTRAVVIADKRNGYKWAHGGIKDVTESPTKRRLRTP